MRAVVGLRIGTRDEAAVATPGLPLRLIGMLDRETTDQDDLRGGVAPWSAGSPRPIRDTVRESFRCDTLVVGAGITGALVGDHLQRLGHDVCIIDRERPGLGSTAASTAMLLWELDSPLLELSSFYGFDQASSIYRASLAAVVGLGTLVRDLGFGRAIRDRVSLYIAAGDAGHARLSAEHALRQRAGLPGRFLDHLALRRSFGIDREAAILSPRCADADPLRLAGSMLASAASQGARVVDAEAVAYDCGGGKVVVGLDGGHVIEARNVVLATGYVMPDFVRSDLHRIASSWAIATPPQQRGGIWPHGALIWEASQPYLYARTMPEGRIVIGGEDDDAIVEPHARDALMPAKAAVLAGKLHSLWPRAAATAAFVWSGAFGETVDGLPLIGPVPGYPRIFAAYGYGGNGITFSYLASRLIGRLIAGERGKWRDTFALDRPRPAGT
jgi:glycine/D-amino acid oxidase-like deaminating enzyme